MSLAIVHSRAATGVVAPKVQIEVHLGKGLPGFCIVGLPEKAVKESKDRVRSALINSGFEFPTRRITVNLSPADLPKEGARFDLPIAVGILGASDQVPLHLLSQYEFAGELNLAGDILAIKGALPYAMAARTDKRKLIMPYASACEAALSSTVNVYAVNHISEVCEHLRGMNKLKPLPSTAVTTESMGYPDLAEVRGQAHAKRALEIAACGGHSLLMIGPPGTGKTMLASRLPSILPWMNDDEALTTASVYSISRYGFTAKYWRIRPFRSPHHSASGVALVGGGNPPRPGEISLAQNGVLFLDELPEFKREVLEALREPLEAGHITISRSTRQIEFPARFQLIAAMNPCPCGYDGDSRERCNCTSEQIQRYQARISGPLLDRIDMHVELTPMPTKLLLQQEYPSTELSEVVRQRVSNARDLQHARQQCANAELLGEQVMQNCQVNKANQAYLADAVEQFGLSARAYHRILKVARSIADLAESEKIQLAHLQEAINYRLLDRKL